MTTSHSFVPALGIRALTPLYDSVVRLTTRESTFKRLLVDEASVRPKERVLEVACGTGTLALLIKQAAPGAEVVGIDIDPAMLARARRKAAASGVEARFVERSVLGSLEELGHFDVALSTLFFHHLGTSEKREALANVRAALRPGGRLHVVDWGPPSSPLLAASFLAVRALDGFAPTEANVRGQLPALIKGAGFSDVTETRALDTPLGTLRFLRAVVA
ncbi:MAG TPA: class I SAM-dependent methyltransferase [Polyangiaceae bacterium]|nr:class I SAM-dependent methyltransferase [Polyangiaceae bacterium]